MLREPYLQTFPELPRPFLGLQLGLPGHTRLAPGRPASDVVAHPAVAPLPAAARLDDDAHVAMAADVQVVLPHPPLRGLVVRVVSYSLTRTVQSGHGGLLEPTGVSQEVLSPAGVERLHRNARANRGGVNPHLAGEAVQHEAGAGVQRKLLHHEAVRSQRRL